MYSAYINKLYLVFLVYHNILSIHTLYDVLPIVLVYDCVSFFFFQQLHMASTPIYVEQ